MLDSFKGRTVERNQEVELYFNLHRKMWSIRDAKTKLVLAHTDSLVSLRNVSFRVNEAGRQRVIREQQKNIHAFARGCYEYSIRIGMFVADESLEKVSYNPYTGDSFFFTLTGEKIPATLAFEKGYFFGKSVYVGEDKR